MGETKDRSLDNLENPGKNEDWLKEELKKHGLPSMTSEAEYWEFLRKKGIKEGPDSEM